MHKNLISEGYTLACVTNSIKKTAIEMLKITGQEEFMSLLVSNEDVKNNKPHPDCYLYAMNKLSTSPEETLIIEDSPKGKQAALATGCSLLEVEDVYDVTLDKIRRFL